MPSTDRAWERWARDTPRSTPNAMLCAKAKLAVDQLRSQIDVYDYAASRASPTYRDHVLAARLQSFARAAQAAIDAYVAE